MMPVAGSVGAVAFVGFRSRSPNVSSGSSRLSSQIVTVGSRLGRASYSAPGT